MPASYTQLYLHCVWATWDRLPLVSDNIERAVYVAVTEQCHQLKCEVIAIGGMPDHVHVLVRLAPTVSISDLLKAMKGASSHLMTHEMLGKNDFFKWQGGYAHSRLANVTSPS